MEEIPWCLHLIDGDYVPDDMHCAVESEGLVNPRREQSHAAALMKLCLCLATIAAEGNCEIDNHQVAIPKRQRALAGEEKDARKDDSLDEAPTCQGFGIPVQSSRCVMKRYFSWTRKHPPGKPYTSSLSVMV